MVPRNLQCNSRAGNVRLNLQSIAIAGNGKEFVCCRSYGFIFLKFFLNCGHSTCALGFGGGCCGPWAALVAAAFARALIIRFVLCVRMGHSGLSAVWPVLIGGKLAVTQFRQRMAGAAGSNSLQPSIVLSGRFSRYSRSNWLMRWSKSHCSNGCVPAHFEQLYGILHHEPAWPKVRHR